MEFLTEQTGEKFMSSSPTLNDLLDQLKQAAIARPFSTEKLIAATENLLVWLNEPQNNTDYNCKQIDSFISTEIMPDPQFKEIPEDIRGILFDMGVTLRDAHSIPRISKNFKSMPDELLARVRSL